MSYGRKRLRNMTREQRRQAKLANAMQSVLTRWKNSIERMGEIELDAALGTKAMVNGHKPQEPTVKIVAGKTDDYWPIPLCDNCQIPLDEARWDRAIANGPTTND
jgi:hypothetical protein